jgi:hypothetical protein
MGILDGEFGPNVAVQFQLLACQRDPDTEPLDKPYT